MPIQISIIELLMSTSHRAPAENACKFDYNGGWYTVCADEDYHIRAGTDTQSTADLTPTAYGAFHSYESIMAE